MLFCFCGSLKFFASKAQGSGKKFLRCGGGFTILDSFASGDPFFTGRKEDAMMIKLKLFNLVLTISLRRSKRAKKVTR